MERKGDFVILTDEEQFNAGVDERDGTILIFPGPTGAGRFLRVTQQVNPVGGREGILEVQGTLANRRQRKAYVPGDVTNLEKFLEPKAKVQP